MNILEYEINADCDEILQPIFLMKWIAQSKVNKIDDDVVEKYINLMLKGIVTNYKNEYYIILKFILKNKCIINVSEITNYIKDMKIKDILEISNSGILAMQCLTKFRKLESDRELQQHLSDLVKYLNNIKSECDYFIDKEKKNNVNVDDNVIKTVKETKYVIYNHYADETIDGMIYIYDNGLLILFENILKDTKKFEYVFLDKNSIDVVKSFINISSILNLEIISKVIEKCKAITVDDILVRAIKYNSYETEQIFLWADSYGVLKPKSKNILGEFYCSNKKYYDYEKSIKYHKEAAEGGIKGSYAILGDLYIKEKDYKNAIKYYQLAQQNGINVKCDLYDAKCKYIKQTELEIFNKYLNIFKKQTKKACVKIEFDGECDKQEVLASKIGGIPYIPQGEDWPIDSEGNRMPLILQVNFEDVNFKGFPQNGILEIFLDKSLDFTNNCVIKYYKKVNESYRTDIQPVDVSEFIISKSFKIRFKNVIDYMSVKDKKFEEIVNEIVDQIIEDKVNATKIIEYAKIEYPRMFKSNLKEKEIIIEMLTYVIEDNIKKHEITMAGYPDFIEEDTRLYDINRFNLTECLFKLEWHSDNKFNWGETGILRFIMTKEAFENARFEEAIFDLDFM